MKDSTATMSGGCRTVAQIDDALSAFSLRVDEGDCATITVHGLTPDSILRWPPRSLRCRNRATRRTY